VASNLARETIQNRLLRNLSAEDFDALVSHMEAIELPVGAVLTSAGEPSTYAYFFEAGLASIIVGDEGGRRAEVGVVGRDGMTDVATILGAGRSAFRTIMRIAGCAYRISVDTLVDVLDARPVLRLRMLRYTQGVIVQLGYTTLAHATLSVEKRLARWLLMGLDQLDERRLRLTHEHLAVILAIRRPSVTDALHVLEGEGWIRARRGEIEIIDRAGMETFVGESYTTPTKLQPKECSFASMVN